MNIRSGRVKGHSAAEMLIDLQKSSKFRILLEHYPEYFLYLKKKKAMLDIDLALAGHAHGGVARIPHIGSLYAPGQGFFPKLTEGRHKFGTGFVVISRGLGGRPFPPRINNKPEIVVIDVASICKK
ncbi:MAG: hypothetical protein IJI14_02785 [Anaerolineaceae bacterium]|nr:hypothetical protein [Anaerolineaceae bacterium]